MKNSKTAVGVAPEGAASEQVLVVSSSSLLLKRLREPLQAAGFPVQVMSSVREMMKSRRQRPFLACFLDLRGGDGACAKTVSACLQARPGERYVVLRGRGDRGVRAEGCNPSAAVFGFMREPFESEEAIVWCRRAATEARLQQGDRSLDDLLYEKFRAFLQNLGPAPAMRLYDLVWERVERPLLLSVLEWTGGNQTKAADILGVHRNTLRAKIRTLKIETSRLGEGNGH